MINKHEVVVAREHLLIMGFRNFLYWLLDETQTEDCKISPRALRQMTGNGMHAVSIGSFILFALGSSDWD